MLGDARPVAVALDDLLHAAWGERRASLGFEQIPVLRVGFQVAAQHQAEALGVQDVAVLAALTPVDEDLALLGVHVLDADADQFADAHGGVEEQPEHDLVLQVAALLDDAEEPLEVGLRQQLGELALHLGLAQAQLAPGLLADVDEVGVAEPLLARDADDLGDDVRFRFFVRRYEILPLSHLLGHAIASGRVPTFRLSPFPRNDRLPPGSGQLQGCRAAQWTLVAPG
jgi:hypothetical protein